MIVECPRHWAPLLRTCPGVAAIVSEGDTWPAFDVQAPLASLSGLLKITPQTVPADVPYLQADPTLVERWRRELETVAGFKIGIAWQGSMNQTGDRRSLPLAHFEAIARVPGVSLVSLQIGPGRKQLETAAFPVTDLGGRFDPNSLDDLAAAMMDVDMVVTVDTAVAHLAGALSVPVWVALSALPDWRWTRHGERSVWYPTMRLFRQQQLGEWQDVFIRMAQELERRLQE